MISFTPTQQSGGNTQSNPSSLGSIQPPVQKVSLSPHVDSEGRGFLQISLLVLFWGMVTVLIVMVGYKYYLSSLVKSKKAEIDKFEAQLAEMPIEEMRRLSNRLKTISQLVKEHPSVNVAFKILEDSVENPVTYERFDFHFSESARGYELLLGAVAPDYHSVVSQVETFKRKPYTSYIPSLKVESIHPDDTGRVTFTLKMPIAAGGVLPEGLLLGVSNMVIDESTGLISTESLSSFGTTTQVQATSTTP